MLEFGEDLEASSAGAGAGLALAVAVSKVPEEHDKVTVCLCLSCCCLLSSVFCLPLPPLRSRHGSSKKEDSLALCPTLTLISVPVPFFRRDCASQNSTYYAEYRACLPLTYNPINILGVAKSGHNSLCLTSKRPYNVQHIVGVVGV